jgi:polysaccharide pyruvyl transferase WcaK-like protein
MSLAYRFVPVKAIREKIEGSCPWIKTVREAEFVGDIRGGDSFSDIYGLRGFVLASLPVMTVVWVGGKLVLFPQTYGPFTHPVARQVARYILRRAKWILSRDKDSIEMIHRLVGPLENVRFCPDVAFALDPHPPAVLAIAPPLPRSRDICTIGINVNGLMYNGGYTRRNMFGLKLDYRAFLAKLVTELLQLDSVRVVLVPHTFAPHGHVESDPDACLQVRQALPPKFQERAHIVTANYDQHEIKAVIGCCDFFIGSRMHSCIAALSQGIPTVGVAYSKKFKGVFESVGASDWVIDGRDVSADDAVGLLLACVEKRHEMRAALSNKPAEVKELLRKTFSDLASIVANDESHLSPETAGAPNPEQMGI